MAQTALAIKTLKQNNYAVLAGDLAMALAALDAVNGNSFVSTGKEVLLFQNTDSAAHTIAITSVPDSAGRLDTSLAAYSIPATSFAVIEMSQLPGWLQGGVINLLGSSALVFCVVLRHM